MTKAELKIALNAEPVAPGSMRKVVIGWKDAGATQQSVLDLCQELREDLEREGVADAYDRLLDIMDEVAGFCSPHRRIWDTQAI